MSGANRVVVTVPKLMAVLLVRRDLDADLAGDVLERGFGWGVSLARRILLGDSFLLFLLPRWGDTRRLDGLHDRRCRSWAAGARHAIEAGFAEGAEGLAVA